MSDDFYGAGAGVSDDVYASDGSETRDLPETGHLDTFRCTRPRPGDTGALCEGRVRYEYWRSACPECGLVYLGTGAMKAEGLPPRATGEALPFAPLAEQPGVQVSGDGRVRVPRGWFHEDGRHFEICPECEGTGRCERHA